MMIEGFEEVQKEISILIAADDCTNVKQQATKLQMYLCMLG